MTKSLNIFQVLIFPLSSKFNFFCFFYALKFFKYISEKVIHFSVVSEGANKIDQLFAPKEAVMNV